MTTKLQPRMEPKEYARVLLSMSSEELTQEYLGHLRRHLTEDGVLKFLRKQVDSFANDESFF